MAGPIVIPDIPETITVHLGPPDSPAPNVTVPFTDYVKNVASSEIYPTWSEAALRANIWAIISFALNRVYTEFYRSRGYDFDITNSTAVDQAFVEGRSYFQNISRLVDDMFNSYIRRQGFVEPLAAKFCNGTTVTCEGLSQWGSENLAQQGYNSVDILRYYYGDDIEIVQNAPIQGITQSYPGTPLRLGSTGPYVTVVQTSLNRISQNFPAIPKVEVDGVYGPQTEAAVKVFQEIFSLVPDGIVGMATWYQIVRIYVGILGLSELESQGQQQYFVREYPDAISLGDTGTPVEQLQYMLAVVAYFIPQVSPLALTGTFDIPTRDAVRSFQAYAGLPVTGSVGAQTWDALYDQFESIETTALGQGNRFPVNPLPENAPFPLSSQFPGQPIKLGMKDPPTGPKPIQSLQTMLRRVSLVDSKVLPVIPDGTYGRNTYASVRSFQNAQQERATGTADQATWQKLVGAHSQASRQLQHPIILPAWPVDQCIRPGTWNLHLYLVQAMLLALNQHFTGLRPTKITGQMDNDTVQGLHWVQKAAGLSETGCLDPETWNYLGKIYRIAIGDGSIRTVG